MRAPWTVLPLVGSSKACGLSLLLVTLFMSPAEPSASWLNLPKLTPRILGIGHPVTNQIAEISVAYFRGWICPHWLPHPGPTRRQAPAENALPFNCNSLEGYKAQQIPTKPGVLESFPDRTRWGGLTFTEDDTALPDSRVGMYSSGEDGDGGIQKARSAAEKMILKPQREGGGNNACMSSIAMGQI